MKQQLLTDWAPLKLSLNSYLMLSPLHCSIYSYILTLFQMNSCFWLSCLKTICFFRIKKIPGWLRLHLQIDLNKDGCVSQCDEPESPPAGPVSGSGSLLKPPPSGGASTSGATGAGTRPSPPQPKPQPGTGFPASSSSSSSSRPVQPGSAGTSATQGRTRPSQSRPDSTQLRPQPPSAGSQGSKTATFYLSESSINTSNSFTSTLQTVRRFQDIWGQI